MRILILGGTVFLGRALVDEALRRGHRLTLFNRGRSNPGLYPQVERLTGDRKHDLSALAGRVWEAVIDTCGYLPGVVALSAAALANSVEHYTFISTESVYASPLQPGLDESASVGLLEDESVEEISGGTYGPLKALCERAVEAALPGRTLVVRPGLIVGPYDASDRFTYWPWRVAQGGRVLAPGRPERGVQFIDVRDLAAWIIRLVERRQTGVYNADGVPGAVSMGAHDPLAGGRALVRRGPAGQSAAAGGDLVGAERAGLPGLRPRLPGHWPVHRPGGGLLRGDRLDRFCHPALVEAEYPAEGRPDVGPDLGAVAHAGRFLRQHPRLGDELAAVFRDLLDLAADRLPHPDDLGVRQHPQRAGGPADARSYTGWQFTLSPTTSSSQNLVWQSIFAACLWALVGLVIIAERRKENSQ
jgi:nucleoside-diphosphate-sugar epimerase